MESQEEHNKTVIEVLADEYQKSFEHTQLTWERRNKISLALICVLGIAALLIFNAPETQPLLVDLIAKILSIDDPDRYSELEEGFTYGFIQTILVSIIIYLLIILYQRSVVLAINYDYLNSVGKDIRKHMKLSYPFKAFLRENDLKESNIAILAWTSVIVHVALMGILLTLFFAARIYEDIAEHNYILGVVNLFFAILACIFYLGYAFIAISPRNGWQDLLDFSIRTK